MRGLFCFDGPMYRDINGIYCNTTLTNQVFERYLKVVDKLTIAIRTFHLEKSYKDENLQKIQLNDLLNIIECPNINSINGMLFDRKGTYEVLYQLVADTDVVFARMPSILSNMVVDIAIKLNKPYLVEVGGCVWDAYWNHSLKGKIIAPYLFWETRRIIKNAPFAVYVTQEFLQKRYPSRGKTAICSNVILDRSHNQILEKRIKKIRSKKLNNAIIIGTTAAINVRYKGQEYIIEAISILNKQGYNFEYHLVGVGTTEYLQSIAKKYGVIDKIKFLGVLLNEDVIKWLDEIDIYAQPSKQEGLPRALIEALSRGCPSIGSTTGGIPELLSKDVVFNNAKVNEICDILKSISLEKMEKLAIVNFNKAKEFESAIIEGRRQNIFNELINYTQKN